MDSLRMLISRIEAIPSWLRVFREVALTFDTQSLLLDPRKKGAIVLKQKFGRLDWFCVTLKMHRRATMHWPQVHHRIVIDCPRIESTWRCIWVGSHVCSSLYLGHALLRSQLLQRCFQFCHSLHHIIDIRTAWREAEQISFCRAQEFGQSMNCLCLACSFPQSGLLCTIRLDMADAISFEANTGDWTLLLFAFLEVPKPPWSAMMDLLSFRISPGWCAKKHTFLLHPGPCLQSSVLNLRSTWSSKVTSSTSLNLLGQVQCPA